MNTYSSLPGLSLGLACGLDPVAMQWLSDLVRVWFVGRTL